ncbi:CBS domain-containing protein [Chloroflexota bacterium]
MRSIPNLSRIFGIRIRLHYTWFIAFGLITATTFTQLPETYIFWQKIVLGIATSLLFFTVMAIRELILNFTASKRGVQARSVTLFVFGGVSRIARETTLPILELLLSMTRLLSNLLIAGIFYGVYAVLVNTSNTVITGLIQWLAFIYFILFLFHFIPGFPLDGGRLLRALLWRSTGDYDRATRITSLTGRGVGLLCIVGGIPLLIIGQQWFEGLWLVGIGLVLWSAATQSYHHAVMSEVLESIMIKNVINRKYPFVTQQLNLGQLVRDYILVTGQSYFVVVDDADLQGIITMRDIKRVPKEHWDSTCVEEVMMPAGKLKAAHLQQKARNVLEQMDELETNHMPVLEEGKVIGIVTRDSLIRLVKIRAKLGV